MSCELLLDTR